MSYEKVIDRLTNEQLDAWATALESGSYSQAKGTLLMHGQYCCLGVLADIMGRLIQGYFVTNCGCGILNDLTRSKDLSYFLDAGTQRDLIRMNDNGKSFQEIAVYIRRTLIKAEGEQP